VAEALARTRAAAQFIVECYNRSKRAPAWSFLMERVYDKYGWVVFLALGLLWLVVGLSQVFNPEGLLENEAQHVTGMSLSELEASSPEATELVRFLMMTVGNLKTSWSFLVLAITLTAYRRGENWAWYTMWLVPAILVSVFVNRKGTLLTTEK
jgi:hypothetical protein